MGWADKAHKKIKAEKMAMEIMNSPRYREARKQDMQQATMRALVTFVFIGLVYLEMTFRCKRKGLMKFLDFVRGVVIDFKDDDKWLEASNEYYKETYDIDVMDYFGMALERNDDRGEGFTQTYAERAHSELHDRIR